MSVTDFPQKRPSAADLERAFSLLREAAATGTPAEKRIAQRMLKASSAPTGGFMRVWIDREREIVEELQARAQTRQEAGKPNSIGHNLCFNVLRVATYSLTQDSQRMTITQAALATQMQLTPANASLAFKELHAIGAVLGRERSGKSITWEIDAEYASKMAEPERLTAIERQRKIRAEEGRDAKKQARLDNVRFLDLGPINDERQPSLID